jgi:hypothetical protein
MNKIDLAYAAGIVDGEGNISIVKRQKWSKRNDKYHLQVRVAMCDKIVVDWFRTHFGGSISCRKRHTINPAHRDCHIWIVSHRSARGFLLLIETYLICKKDQAQLGIAFQNTKYSGGAKGIKGHPPISDRELALHEEMYLQMRGLKH